MLLDRSGPFAFKNADEVFSKACDKRRSKSRMTRSAVTSVGVKEAFKKKVTTSSRRD
jgi:hypothetical protein